MDDARYKLEDFELYQVAREYRKKIYRIIKQLPPDERYCLDKQMRKAAVSISNNIAEGHGAGTIRRISSFAELLAVPWKRSLMT